MLNSCRLRNPCRLALPHLGRDLAAASFNYHQGFFGERFAIRIPEGAAHSACVGFGLERWVYATVCQFGPEPEGWPGPIRALLTERS